LNYYGAMPTSEVLRRYGYVTPEYHRYDEVEIPRDAVAKALDKATGLPLATLVEIVSHADYEYEDFADDLQGVGIDADEDGDPFIIERDSGAPNEEGRLVEEAKMNEFPELEEELKDALKVVKKHRPDVVADKKQRDGIVNAVIIKVLTDKLARYPTSIRDDRAMLKKSDITSRHRMAIEVRLGEKVLLEEALTMLKTRDDAGADKGEERPSKKIKSKA